MKSLLNSVIAALVDAKLVVRQPSDKCEPAAWHAIAETRCAHVRTVGEIQEPATFRRLFGSVKCNAFKTAEATDAVIGAVYEIPTNEKLALDRAEGLGSGYREEMHRQQRGPPPLSSRTNRCNLPV